MKYLEILETTCSTDVSSCCKDYGIAMYLYIIKKALDIIHVIVPIILIVMATVQLIKMMTNPDDKKGNKSLLNKFIAAVLVFFIPFIVNLILGILPDGFEISSCWKSAEEIAPSLMDSNNTTTQTTESIQPEKEKKSKTKSKKKKRVAANMTKRRHKIGSNKKGKKVKASEVSKDGEGIIEYASQFVGNPYRYGGYSYTNGIDCSRFVCHVLKDLKLYNGGCVGSSDWISLGKKVSGGLKNAQAGDVVVYRGHVGFYDGKGHLVEAQGRKYGITNTRNPKNSRKPLLGVRRFV